MALTKIINDENKSYRPVLTDKLVLDAVPTVNSFNSVTSDAVARAVAGASGEVPQVTENDNGKILTAVYDAGGPAVEWAEAQSGPSYTAGNGIDINSSNAISVLPDNQTIQVAIPEIKGTKLNFLMNDFWTFPTAEFSNAEATSKLTQLLLRLDGPGSYTLRMADSTTQSGKKVKIEVGDSYQFTHSVLSTGMVLSGGSYAVLDGTSTTGALSLPLNNNSTFDTAFDFTGDTSFADVFGGQTVWMRFRAWDEVNNEVVGNALTMVGDPSMYMKTDASPVQVSLKYSKDWGTYTNSGLKPSANGICVSNPVPNSTDADAGKVLTAIYGGGRAWSAVPKELPASLGTAGQVLQVNAGATGVEWATPSSGGGVQITFVNRNSDTFATVKTAYDAGNLLYMGWWDFPLVDTDGASYFMFQKLSYDPDFSAVYIYRWKIDNVYGWTNDYVQLATE